MPSHDPSSSHEREPKKSSKLTTLVTVNSVDVCIV